MSDSAFVCFDLDGVLYSSEPFLGEAYREAIALVNERRPGSFARVPATQEILEHVGWPVSVILGRLFPTVEDEAIRLLYVATLDVICRHVAAGDGILFPDVPATLRELRRDGYRLAVASNGRGPYVRAVLDTYGLADCFVDPVTADEVGEKAAILRVYFRRYSVAPARAVMIGDRTSDVEAARAVGCLFVGCDYGHGHRREIEAAGPIVERFADLPSVIRVVVAGS